MKFFLSHFFHAGSAAHSAFNGVKSLERESGFSSLASDEVSNRWSYDPTPQCFVITSVLVTDKKTRKYYFLCFCKETEKGTYSKIKKRRKKR